ncbi:MULTISPECIES: hypothetical protein [unclassified Kribbella]|uniref:hypothetical protein n=1 Tax=unclassified Kribbella TaxID=2644121 RepID=UPI003407F903
MIAHRKPCTAYEFTVVGELGPMLRAAFPGQRIAAMEPCTVIRVEVPADRVLDLVDLIGLFESAGVVVEDLYRSSAPDPSRPGAVE